MILLVVAILAHRSHGRNRGTGRIYKLERYGSMNPSPYGTTAASEWSFSLPCGRSISSIVQRRRWCQGALQGLWSCCTDWYELQLHRSGTWCLLVLGEYYSLHKIVRCADRFQHLQHRTSSIDHNILSKPRRPSVCRTKLTRALQFMASSSSGSKTGPKRCWSDPAMSSSSEVPFMRGTIRGLVGLDGCAS